MGGDGFGNLTLKYKYTWRWRFLWNRVAQVFFLKVSFFEYLGRNPPFVSECMGSALNFDSPLVRGDPATTLVWAGPAAQQREWTETDDRFHRWYGTGFFHKQNIQYTA